MHLLIKHCHGAAFHFLISVHMTNIQYSMDKMIFVISIVIYFINMNMRLTTSASITWLISKTQLITTFYTRTTKSEYEIIFSINNAYEFDEISVKWESYMWWGECITYGIIQLLTMADAIDDEWWVKMKWNL